jgi:hypothetical protein
MIEAGIAAMGPVGPIRLHHEDDRRAVRVLFAGETRQLDDDMGLVDDAAQQIGGARTPARKIRSSGGPSG